MATEERQDLTPDQYAVGQQVEKDGHKLEIRDVIHGASGNAFSVVGHPGDHIAALIPTATIREEFDAVAEEDREVPAADADSAATDGTDGTGGGE